MYTHGGLLHFDTCIDDLHKDGHNKLIFYIEAIGCHVMFSNKGSARHYK